MGKQRHLGVRADPAMPSRRRGLDIGGGGLAAIFAAAERNVDVSDIEPELLAYLHANSRAGLPREQWEREIHFALSLDRTLRACIVGDPSGTLDLLFPRERRASLAAQLHSADGTLVLVHHGGYAALLRALFRDLFPAGVIIAARGAHSAKEGAFALFAAREALVNGSAVLISPEGRSGRASGTISTLGAERAVADGAPFLAHETRCNTVFLSIAREANGFVPAVASAPRAADGERFADYRERFFRFYAEQLERTFTGDPRNLPLVKSWRATFTVMLTGNADTKRRLRPGQ